VCQTCSGSCARRCLRGACRIELSTMLGQRTCALIPAVYSLPVILTLFKLKIARSLRYIHLSKRISSALPIDSEMPIPEIPPAAPPIESEQQRYHASCWFSLVNPALDNQSSGRNSNIRFHEQSYVSATPIILYLQQSRHVIWSSGSCLTNSVILKCACVS
jgi:hypothetical protein